MRNKKYIIILFGIFLLLILSYAGYTARHLILGPQLALDVPGGVLTVTSQIIEIAGTAQNTTSLTINNAVLLLDETGAFAERMLLSTGTNVFIFDAEDKFGRQSQETLQVIYTPKDDDVLQLKDADINNERSEEKSTPEK